MRPTRIVGAWPDMPGLPAEEEPMDPDEPATVLTLGRPRLPRFARFVRTSRPAERLAVGHPAMVAGTAAARLPRFVATFSIWRTVSEMRDYALGRPDPSHLNAIKADRKKTFHHQEAFVRFRPYASTGSWATGTPWPKLRAADHVAQDRSRPPRGRRRSRHARSDRARSLAPAGSGASAVWTTAAGTAGSTWPPPVSPGHQSRRTGSRPRARRRPRPGRRKCPARSRAASRDGRPVLSRMPTPSRSAATPRRRADRRAAGAAVGQ